ncbi:MAG: alkaline phosphatase D family protein [Myxococcota bacterium]
MSTRREVLQAAAALGAGLAVGCGSPEPPADPRFPLGVASGDPTSSSVLLWTCYRGRAELVVSVDDEAGARVFSAPVTVADGGFAHVDVPGLAPGRAYRYLFSDSDGSTSEGRFRTAPDDDARVPLSFGATCCTKLGHPMDTLERAAGRALDAFLLLGDTAYVDGAHTLAEYRRNWAKTLSTAPQRALRAAHAVIATWDDHELANNWNAENIGRERFETAASVFFEHQPARRQPHAPFRVWRRLRFGRTAEVFVLDTRGERRPSAQEFLSRAQLDWLEAGLAESSAAFKLVLNPVPIAAYPGALFQSFELDRWQGYPQQRTEILQHVEDRDIRGVLWLAGDFHLACAGRVSLQGPGQNAVEVLVGPGAQAANPSPTYPAPPQFDWASGVNNYTVIDLDPATLQARIRHVDGGDATLFDHTYVL